MAPDWFLGVLSLQNLPPPINQRPRGREKRMPRIALLITLHVALTFSCSGCATDFAVERIDRAGALHDEWPTFPLLARDVQFQHLDDQMFARILPDLKRLELRSLNLSRTEI